MIRIFCAALVAAGLCCTPSVRAQSANGSASVDNAASSTSSTSPTSPTSQPESTSAIGSTPAKSSAPALNAPALRAQPDNEGGYIYDPVKGSREIQVWFGGGPGFYLYFSVRPPLSVVETGVRYGWVLTDAHGPGPLRGRFSYAFGVMPAMVVSLPNRVVYGGGIDAFALRWIFVPHHGISSFVDLSGGGLLTTEPVPARETNYNFTPTAAVGLLRTHGKYTWSFDVRWFHISNAHLTSYDPGINTLQFRLGVAQFRRRAEK
jgi:hypothetical protein